MLFRNRRLKGRCIGPASCGVIVKMKTGETRLVQANREMSRLMFPGECYALDIQQDKLKAFKEMPNAQLPY